MARIKASAAAILVSLVCMAWAVVPELNLAFCSGKYDGYYCQHCWQVVYCREGIVDEAASVRCDADQVCELYSSPKVAICAADADSSGTRCACTTNVCDPYNLNLVDQCNNITGITDIEDCGAADGTCFSGECGALPSCDGAPAGWNPILPACTDGFYCTEGGALTDVNRCDAGQYVGKSGQCIPAPPEPCEFECKGLCPDFTDCNRYYLCDGNGHNVTGPETCPGGAFFAANADPPSCSGTDESVCAQLIFCDFGFSPATASFSAHARPHACSKETTGDYADSECSQRYLSCRDAGHGEYAWVRTKCPDDHVFSTDPKHPYCVARETAGC